MKFVVISNETPLGRIVDVDDRTLDWYVKQGKLTITDNCKLHQFKDMHLPQLVVGKQRKTIMHFGGFATALPCNGSAAGYTSKRPNDVTCKRCKALIKKHKWTHPNDMNKK